jgi:hypothetical protein
VRIREGKIEDEDEGVGGGGGRGGRRLGFEVVAGARSC